MRLKFPQVLSLVFVIAKLMGSIDWSWFWVFWPIYLAISIELSRRLLDNWLEDNAHLIVKSK